MQSEQFNDEGIDNVGEFRLHNLWPIPIYENTITPFNNKWVDIAFNETYERMHSNNGDITVNRYILDLPEFFEIRQHVIYHLNVLMKNYFGASDNVEFCLLNSWINKHHKGDYGQLHNHQNSLISGCLYLQVNDHTGGIRFYKNTAWTNLLPLSVAIEYKKLNHINSQYYTISPKQGSIVIFPSHLEHMIEKNQSDETRCSLAFNFYVRGKLGKEEYELTLR